jgi:hydrogenase maturation protease
MSAPTRILVAGIGNIFFGDDAFGCEVVGELLRRPLPEGVTVIDYGIRSYDLAYAIMEGYEATILVDAVSRGQQPGTVFLIEPDVENLAASDEIPNGHGLNPTSVLQMVRSMGGVARGLYLVGCEPAVLESDDGSMELSESVRAAVPHAVLLIQDLIRDLLKVESLTPASPDREGGDIHVLS